MTYTEIIKEHLEKYGSITSKEAINKYGNTRLSVTIYILRSQGLNIITDYETSKNRYGKPRYGKPVTYGVYKLVKANE